MPASPENITRDFNDNFFNDLAGYLKTLPNYIVAEKREDSFKTAAEIKEWSGLPYTPGEIEDILLKEWSGGHLNKIRPAKYPHQTKLERLWGHVDNLWPLNDLIRPYNNAEITALPDLKLPPGSPNIFVSFNSADKKLAISIREHFAKWGWRAWIYINQIQLDGKIAEEVRSAVSDCKAAVVLITATSIGSAWVYTEFQTLTQMGKDVCAVFDLSSKELGGVLETWRRSDHYSNYYDGEKTDALTELYKENNGTHHIEGFETTMRTFLSALSFFQILAIYPKRPADWDGPCDFIDFDLIEDKMHLH
ncbi:MAG: toll/interleukin-1 receptor domain-containing protein [Ginsengibacter sp.]